MKEIADPRIVAVAKDSLAFEVLLVVPKLVLNVGKLSVKLIFLGALGLVEVVVPCHND